MNGPIARRSAAIRWILLLLWLLCAELRAETLRVGISELDFPPYHYLSDDKLVGVSIEYARAVADKAGYQLDFERIPFERILHELRDGRIDMVVLLFKNQQREEYIHYLDQPYIHEKSYILVATDHEVFPDRFDGDFRAFKDYPVVSVRGYFHGEQFTEANYLEKQEVTSESEVVRRLLSGRPMVAISNRAIVSYHARLQNQEDRIRVLLPAIDNGEDYLAFSRKLRNLTEVVQRFNRAQQQYMNSNAYQTLMKKYGFDDDPVLLQHRQ